MKNIYVAIFIILVIVAYLFWTHHRIYQIIGAAGLRFHDIKSEYTIGNDMGEKKKIIYSALGDSLTSGVGADTYEESYPYLLATKMAKEETSISFINNSYPGARTDDIIKNLLDNAIANKPDIVTVLIGVNDIHGFVPITKFKKNYEKIVQELKNKTQAKIVLISIPNIGTDALLGFPYNIYFRQKTDEFNEVIKKLALQYQVKYIDLCTPTTEILKIEGVHYARDNFHPSASVYKTWAEIIYDKLD